MKNDKTLTWALEPVCRCWFLCFCAEKKTVLLREEMARLHEIIEDRENLISRMRLASASEIRGLDNQVASLTAELDAERKANAGRVKALNDKAEECKKEWIRAEASEGEAGALRLKLAEVLGKAGEMRNHVLKLAFHRHAPELAKHINAAVAIEFKDEVK